MRNPARFLAIFLGMLLLPVASGWAMGGFFGYPMTGPAMMPPMMAPDMTMMSPGMSMMQPPAYGPFTPYPQTGQIMAYPQYDPAADLYPVYVASQFNWAGAQPLGQGSYMPPIGLGAFGNRDFYNRAFSGQ